jgi:serpin B
MLARTGIRHHQARVRFVGVFVAFAIVAGACGGSALTPGPTTTTPTATPSPTDTPTSTPSPTPYHSSVPATIEMAMGKAGLLAPADDYGSAAAGEINAFGFDLLHRLDSNGNLCVSPTSIALALAMVRPGAKGTTAAEMDRVLHSLGSTGQNAEMVALLQSLAADNFYDDSNWTPEDPSATPDHTGVAPAVELDVSNAAFAQKGMTLEPAYLDALSSGFGAGVGLLDYKTDPEAARLAINKWASDGTKGRIPEVLHQGDVTNQTRIALANAIYLKAAWQDPFDPTKTTLQPFTNRAGAKLSVPTMAAELPLQYGTGTGYKAVKLWYTGRTMDMTIIVPNDMTSFVAGLDAAKIKAIDAGLRNYDVTLTLPKFSAESRFDLAKVLQAMGMKAVFTSAADLSGITTDEQLALYKVIHQANIDVVEEGTTASAVTVALGWATGGPDTPPKVQFHVDKPFLYLIRDNSGAVLFMGRIDDPSK